MAAGNNNGNIQVFFQKQNCWYKILLWVGTIIGSFLQMEIGDIPVYKWTDANKEIKLEGE